MGKALLVLTIPMASSCMFSECLSAATLHSGAVAMLASTTVHSWRSPAFKSADVDTNRIEGLREDLNTSTVRMRAD